MSIWHTDRQDPAGGEQAVARSTPVGPLVGIAKQHGLALGLSRQNRWLWLLAFALAILAHLAMTVWLMMSVAPQTGTQQPAAVAMLFEAPSTPLPATAQPRSNPQEQPQPAPEMKEMAEGDEQPLPQEETLVLPPSVQPEAEHLPPASAVPKKLAVTPAPMRHAPELQMRAKPVSGMTHTGVSAPDHMQAKTDRTATGGPSTAQASAAAAGQKGGFQLSCSAPEAHYPVSARHLHEEGEALAEVSLNAKGQVIAARLVKSTGYDDLDDQALQTVKNLHCTAPEATGVTGRIPIGFHIQ